MIRRTIQECIDYFNFNSFDKERAIRGMEELGEWETAAEHWELIGRKEDANCCRLIHESIAKGDAYRTDIKHLNSWVDETESNGIMERDEAVKLIYPELDRIYKIHFH